MTVPIYSIFELKDEQISFFESYDLNQVCISNKLVKTKLVPKEKRICRFCGKRSPDTTFNRKAHIIPNFLGNNNLISDFECDRCNNKFSLFETDLTSYLGIYRVFNPINNKKPKLKSDTIVAKEITLKSGKIITYVINSNLDKGSFDVNLNNGQTEIKYAKPSYTPINIYKLFLKIALSCLSDDEILNYKYLLHHLSSNIDQALIPFAKNIGYYELSIKINSPRVLIFKRKNNISGNFIHQVHFYFQEFVYMFFLPYNSIDIILGKYKDQNIEIELCPPLLFDDPLEPINYFRDFIDFSSPNKEKQKEKINFETNPENLKTSAAWDKVTGINKDHKFGEVPIEGIIMCKRGELMTEEDLAEIQNLFKELRQTKKNEHF